MAVISLAKYNKSETPLYKKTWFVMLLSSIILIGAFLYFYLISPLLAIKGNYDQLKNEIHTIESFKSHKNLQGMESQLPSVLATVGKMKSNLLQMSYAGYIPYLNNYYNDGFYVVNGTYYLIQGVNAITPSLNKIAPLLGYSTKTTDNAHTLSGKQKIYAVIHALPTLAPALQSVYPDFVKSNDNIQKINAQYIPSSITKGKGININSIKSIFGGIVKNIPTFDKSVSVIENILGVPTPTRYLLMFQNSGEIRPTGGFMTAYGFITFNNGELGTISAHNIYNLSNVVRYKPLAPKPLYVYNATYYWHLRDANTSPNVPSSVQNIYAFYNSIPNAPHINGVIFIDTWFVDSLIKDVGGFNMPQVYNNMHITSSNANYYMEYMAEKSGLPQSERKAFISVMMHILISKVFSSHGSTATTVLSDVIQNLSQKQILIYFNNPLAENLISQYNWGGIIPKKTKGNYLQVVEANLAGAKDNYFMGETLNINISKSSNGRYIQTSSITWINPAVYDNWLVGPYLSWVRFYTPLGSKLMYMKGTDGFLQNYNNYTVDKSVFGNHIKIHSRLSKSVPPTTGTMSATYELPEGTNIHSLLIQKQPGEKGQWVHVNYGNIHKSFFMTKDVTVSL